MYLVLYGKMEIEYNENVPSIKELLVEKTN